MAPVLYIRKISILSILLFIFLVYTQNFFAESSDQPADKKTITIIMDNNYPPFSFRDTNGNLVGISIDMWRLWEKQTGKKAEITGLPWEEAIARMDAGDFDVIDTVFFSEERAKKYDFTKPYIDVDVVIFFHSNVSGIINLDSLNGFVVGMHKGDSTVEDVRKKGVTVKEYESYHDVVKAAKRGEIVVFVLDKPSGMYYLYKEDMQKTFKYTQPIIKGQLHRAIKKGDPILLSSLNKGFEEIPKNKYYELNRKWFGTPVFGKEYLKILFIILLIILAIILWLIIMNRILIRKVHTRTSQLKKELEQRMSAEESLIEREEFLDTIIENIPAMIFIKDAKELRFIRFNRAGEDLLGFKREELVGKNDYDFFPKEEADFFTSKDREVISGKKLCDIPEEKIQTRYFGERYLHTKKIPIFDKNGIPIYLLGISYDITESRSSAEELKRVQELLKTAVEQTPAGILIANAPDVRIRVANSAALGIRGQSEELLTNIPVEKHPIQWQTFWPDGKPVAPEDLPLSRAVLKGETVSNVEVIIKRPDGEPRWVLANAAPVRNSKGEVVAGIVIFPDITELKKAEEAKLKLESQLQQSQKMEAVGRLAGGIAHDFNNMLNVILGYCEILLSNTDSSSPIYKDLSEINTAAERSANLTKQLLAFSRKQNISPTIINLNSQLKTLEQFLKRLIGEDIELSLNLSGNLWNILIDPTQVDQIIANLLVNSRDAMPSGGKISIETKNVSITEEYCKHNIDFKPGDYVRMTVTDNGCGMSKETMDHIFEPFYSTKEIGKGTGLGMSTVYGIIKQNNGYINIYSEIAQGTSISIYLPGYTGSEKINNRTDETIKDFTGNETILLVEDQDQLRLVITRILEDCGYKLLTSSAPSEALEICKEYKDKIHLLLSDMVMPIMNGKELSEKIMDLRPDIKVLIMSGYTSETIFEKGLYSGNFHFIQKPFSHLQIAKKIRETLAK